MRSIFIFIWSEGGLHQTFKEKSAYTIFHVGSERIPEYWWTFANLKFTLFLAPKSNSLYFVRQVLSYARKLGIFWTENSTINLSTHISFNFTLSPSRNRHFQKSSIYLSNTAHTQRLKEEFYLYHKISHATNADAVLDSYFQLGGILDLRL